MVTRGETLITSYMYNIVLRSEGRRTKHFVFEAEFLSLRMSALFEVMKRLTEGDWSMKNGGSGRSGS